MNFLDNLITPSATLGGGVSVVPASAVNQDPSIVDQLQGLLLVASGNKPLQVASPALPDWLLPVGAIALIIFLFK